jgi:hypothetical protein
MIAAALLTHLRTRGVTVRAVGSQLELTAPRGDRLTADLLDQVRAVKPDLLALLDAEAELFEERAAVREFDGGLSHLVAERLARRDVERMRGPETPGPVTLDHLTHLLDLEPCTAPVTPIPPSEEQAVMAYIAEINVKAPSSPVETPNPVQATPARFGIRSGHGGAGRRQQ